MNTKLSASFVLLASLLLPAVTRADSMIVELVNFSFGQGTSNALPSSGAPFDVSVAQFDQSLGTLNSVTLSLQASGTVEADAFNNTASTQGYSQSTATLNFGVTDPDGSSIAINPNTTLFAGTIAPHAFIATGTTPFSLSPAAIDILSSDFGLYETSGSGDFTLSFNSDGESGPITSSIFAPSGVFTGGNAHVTGTETVTYDYTAIPEPSVSGAVLGCAALLGAVGLRKRLAGKSSSNPATA
ncbi:MAG TPA: choice-of-anchor E domain-containing protein [Opitutaceae bacterium]|jgi:hypothetical protein|nr:choice-of-anchor E domain-containing protein [Opitutaceae bacterium]